MLAALAVFLITLGLAQTISAWFGWRALSLIGPGRWLGLGIGVFLLLLGGLGVAILAPTWAVLAWVLPAVPLAVGVLFLTGSIVRPPVHPDNLFNPAHPAHGGCQRLDLMDGEDKVPAYLLHPPAGTASGEAVCLLHGSGDSKSSFKWRLVRALLAQGLTVLTLDLPGHGENQAHLLTYPDCLSVLPTGVNFLRTQTGIEQVGVLGISLGAAIALAAIATRPEAAQVDALALLEMPLWVHYSQALVRTEGWRALRAPVLDLFSEISLAQIRRSWQAGAIRSRHSTAEIFELLDPLDRIRQLDPRLPLLLVYSREDPIAPLAFGKSLKAAAPQATLLTVYRASHITLTLMQPVNRQVAKWVGEQLGRRKKRVAAGERRWYD